MPSQILNRHEWPGQAGQTQQPEAALWNHQIPLPLSTRDALGRFSALPDPRAVHRRVFAEETAITGAEPEEVLIADRRSDLSPSQMVDRKLMVLLGTPLPDVFNQAVYGCEDLQSRAGQRTPLFPQYARWQTGIKSAE
jgi:hypothetical protein